MADDAAESGAAGVGKKPTIDSIHRDIALANQYRLELIKLLLAIAAGLLAFTVTFRPMLTRVEWPYTMWLGWLGLAVSMIGGMIHMHGWDHYYTSYRDYDWKFRDSDGKEKGKRARSRINTWREVAMWTQFMGFAVGVVFIAVFAAVNLKNVTKSPEIVAPLQAQPDPKRAPSSPAAGAPSR